MRISKVEDTTIVCKGFLSKKRFEAESIQKLIIFLFMDSTKNYGISDGNNLHTVEGDKSLENEITAFAQRNSIILIAEEIYHGGGQTVRYDPNQN